jgi:hypothetical protein
MLSNESFGPRRKDGKPRAKRTYEIFNFKGALTLLSGLFQKGLCKFHDLWILSLVFLFLKLRPFLVFFDEILSCLGNVPRSSFLFNFDAAASGCWAELDD